MANTGHIPTTREKNMNTIQITNSMGQVVNYTETEINTIIKNGATFAADTVRLSEEIRKIRHEVRDFFNEVEWESGEQCVQKSDVNRLLESIRAEKLTTQYSGTATISFTFSVEADDEDEARSIIEDNTSVSSYGYDLEGDETTEVNEIDEQ